MDDCLFCKIIRKEIDSKVLYEDDDIIAFMDVYPNAIGHTLVVPKKHCEDIYDVNDETLLKMYKTAKKLGKDIMNKLDKKSATFLINYGEDQSIKHIHLHVLPNYIKREKTDKSVDEIYDILKG